MQTHWEYVSRKSPAINFELDLQIYSKRLFNVTSATVGLFYLSTCFQLGYFRQIGIEFISTLGSSDIITSIAFLWPFIIALLILLELFERQFSKLEFPKWFTDVGTISMTMLLIGIFLIVVFSGLVTISRASASLDIAILLLIIIWNIHNINVLKAQMQQQHAINLRDAVFATIAFGILLYNLGEIYSEYMAGRACKVVLKENAVIEGYYYRSVESGHLFKLGEKTVYLNGDEVVQISCQH